MGSLYPMSSVGTREISKMQQIICFLAQFSSEQMPSKVTLCQSKQERRWWVWNWHGFLPQWPHSDHTITRFYDLKLTGKTKGLFPFKSFLGEKMFFYKDRIYSISPSLLVKITKIKTKTLGGNIFYLDQDCYVQFC